MTAKINKLVPSITILFIVISSICCEIAFAQNLTLTIDSIDGSQVTPNWSGIITINYTVTKLSGNSENITTIDHAFSTDGGTIWLPIDSVMIGNNDSKPPGSSFITWDTTAGTNNLADQHNNEGLAAPIKGSTLMVSPPCNQC